MAAEFGERTSRASVAALASLLPGIKYFSIGVLSPSNPTAVVASSSGTRAGPNLLSLHTANASAVGVVATRRQGLQASLAGAGGALLRSFTDITAMLEEAPSCGYVVCLPLLNPPQPYCPTVAGTLLLGFSSPPDLGPGRVAGLTALACLLSRSLEDSVGRVVCTVEQMIGAHADGCAACARGADEDDEDEDEAPAIPASAYADARCSDASPRGGGDAGDGQPPALQLALESIEEHPDEGLSPCGSPQCGAAAEAPPMPTPTPLPRFRFSKALKSSVTVEDLRAQHPVWLTYARPELESEFAAWLQGRLLPIDALFTCLVVLALALLRLCRPTAVAGTATSPMASVPFALPLLLPCLLALSWPGLYRRHRDVLVAGVRFYLVASMALLAGPVGVGAPFPPPPAWWVSSFAEVLATPAIGLQLRFSRHLVFQAALLALLALRIPALCAAAAGGAAATPCVGGALAFCAAAGYALPALALHRAERRSRVVFGGELLGAAALGF